MLPVSIPAEAVAFAHPNWAPWAEVEAFPAPARALGEALGLADAPDNGLGER